MKHRETIQRPPISTSSCNRGLVIQLIFFTSLTTSVAVSYLFFGPAKQSLISQVVFGDHGGPTNASLSPTPLNHTHADILTTRTPTEIMVDIPEYRGPCAWKRRVFGLGACKTGTTTIGQLLEKLGYLPKEKCKGFYPAAPMWWFYWSDPGRWNDTKVLKVLRHYSDKSLSCSDGPWNTLYPFYEQWYGRSKYILTVRDSTWDLANSELKMMVRKRMMGTEKKSWPGFSMTDENQFQLFLDRQVKHFGVPIEEFVMAVARRYELHNKRVLQFFNGRNGTRFEDDLLVLNFKDEGAKEKLLTFLGCTNSDLEIKKYNAAPEKQRDVLPEKYDLDWRNFGGWSMHLRNVKRRLFEVDELPVWVVKSIEHGYRTRLNLGRRSEEFKSNR